MAYYDLSKEERAALAEEIHQNIEKELGTASDKKTLQYFNDEDTYIRKAAYLAAGRIYHAKTNLREALLKLLLRLSSHSDAKVRQTAINAAGEIGMKEFEQVEEFFDKGLFDEHHSVRNAVIGSIKKMGEKNPKPVLSWAKKYLHHPDKEIRREICHGIELRGRKHPEDILPLLKELQFDKTARVRTTLVHVIGQISYKKNCLEKVAAEIKNWENKELLKDAIEEIIDVHERYKNFAVKSQDEARKYLDKLGLT